MTQKTSNTSKPTVAVMSRPGALSLELVKQVLKNLCSVVLISDKSKNWEKYLDNIDNKNSITLMKISHLKKVTCDYLIMIELGEDAKNSAATFHRIRKNIDRAIEVSKENLAKTLFVVPYVQESICHQKTLVYLKTRVKQEGMSVGLVYVGHVIKTDSSFFNENSLTRILKEVVDGQKLSLPKKEILYYPVNAKTVSKHLVKSLFSFGTYGLETAIISKPLRSKILYKYLAELRPGLGAKNFSQSIKYAVPVTSKVRKVIKLQGNFETLLGGYFRNLLKVKEKKLKKVLRKVNLKIRRSSGRESNNRKERKITHTSKLLVIVFSTFIIPLLLMAISVSTLVLGVKNIKNGNISFANNVFLISGWTGNAADKFFGVFEDIPAIGFLFDDLRRTNKIVIKMVEVGKSGVVLASLTSDLIDKITGDEKYSLDEYFNNISLELDDIYRELGFLQSEMVSAKTFSGLLKEKGIKDSEIIKIREKLFFAKKLVNEFPDLLGEGGERVYLVLSQNNLELRPTGGFIGSFALVKFADGRLVNIDVRDIYSADSQLKGRVEPPFPIKSYLGEANWFLRDSNWDPDFPTSAKQAKWFLEKEIGEQVDGVFGIDLELAKDLLEATGPLLLSDFEREITQDNLYEITQTEIEENSFPGSHKKVNFLTALSKGLMDRLVNLPSNQQVGIAETFFDNLEERHIQIFFSDINAQKAISSLGWSGEIVNSISNDNLYADWMGMVEANVGMNKQNYFVQRSAKMEIDLRGEEIERKLSVILKNNSQNDNRLANRYKAYLRVLVPAGNKFGPVEILQNSEKELLEAEVNNVRSHMEAGVLIEVLPKQEKQIQFSWTIPSILNFVESGTYLMFWRKQAGTLNDPILVNYNFPRGLNISSFPPFSLTGAGVFGYNTELSRDFVSQIYW